jgi:hypothetical protein
MYWRPLCCWYPITCARGNRTLKTYYYSIERYDLLDYEYRVVLSGYECFVDYFYTRKDANKWVRDFERDIKIELGHNNVQLVKVKKHNSPLVA